MPNWVHIFHLKKIQSKFLNYLKFYNLFFILYLIFCIGGNSASNESDIPQLFNESVLPKLFKEDVLAVNAE